MRFHALCAVLLVLLVPVALYAQEAPSRPQAPAEESALSPEQKESLQKLTALFITTVILIVIAMAAIVIVGLTIRRRLTSIEKRQTQAATQLEDLWWKMEAPNPFEDEGKDQGKDEGKDERESPALSRHTLRPLAGHPQYRRSCCPAPMQEKKKGQQ